MPSSTDRRAAREGAAKLSGQSKGEALATLSGPQMTPEAGRRVSLNPSSGVQGATGLPRSATWPERGRGGRAGSCLGLIR